MNEVAVKQLPPTPDRAILRIEVGSTAHGTGLPGHEDQDEIVIYIEGPETVFGPQHSPRGKAVRTQPVGVPSGPEDTDRTEHTLRHFLYLAAAGNPSIMMCFWAPVIEADWLGEQLRGLAPNFVGRHLIPKYRGYMKAQLDRLLGNRGGRHGQMRKDETGAGFDTKYAMHAARLGAQGIELLDTGRLELPIANPTGDFLRSIRRGEVPLEEVVAYIERADAMLEAFESQEDIPAGPNRERIAEWSYAAHLIAWGDAVEVLEVDDVRVGAWPSPG